MYILPTQGPSKTRLEVRSGSWTKARLDPLPKIINLTSYLDTIQRYPSHPKNLDQTSQLLAKPMQLPSLTPGLVDRSP
ncbi:hypothetical protein DSO57_1012693 [Entomophthora muscae]|uniref:Uncharacterized protein n=1 Tax=Entomophthora muscae TaxID=34485 RepID=A0ACC2SIT0_9FUNG|nr:hypothetical protein DSO57_1012693 [Entomophthora muscae]